MHGQHYNFAPLCGREHAHIWGQKSGTIKTIILIVFGPPDFAPNYNSEYSHIWAASATCLRTAAEGGGKRGNRIRRADTRTCFAALQRGRHSRRPSYPVTRRSWTNPPSAPAKTRCEGRTQPHTAGLRADVGCGPQAAVPHPTWIDQSKNFCIIRKIHDFCRKYRQKVLKMQSSKIRPARKYRLPLEN